MDLGLRSRSSLWGTTLVKLLAILTCAEGRNMLKRHEEQTLAAAQVYSSYAQRTHDAPLAVIRNRFLKTQDERHNS